MGLAGTSQLSSLTFGVGIALFTAQVYPRDTEGYVPVCSELVCWILVVAAFELLPHLRDSNSVLTAPGSLLSWIVAASIGVTTLSFSVEDNAWITPAVTPILVALRRTSLLPSLRQSHPEYLRSAWLPLGGAASVLTLAPAQTYSKPVFAGLALLGLVGLYGCLIRIFERVIEHNDGFVQGRMVHLVRSIGVRTIGLLAMLAIALVLALVPGTAPYVAKAVLAGSIKAGHWIAVFSLVQDVPWEIATTIWTCAAASRGSFTPDAPASLGLLQTFARLTLALLAMYQTIEFLPKTTRGRYLLYIFAIWPMFSLVHHTPLGGRVTLVPGEIWTQKPSGADVKRSPRHPIEELVLAAQVNFALLLKSQSKTLEDAEKEYRSRYSREPPPGFDKWFAYAQSKQSILIDDFDMINDNLKPFWQVSPQRLLESINHVSSIDDLALRKCGFTNGEYHGQGGGWIVEDLGKLLWEVSQDLPDVEFAFDVVDEPRVVITQQMLNTGGVSEPDFQNERHKSIWPRVTGSCQGVSLDNYLPAVYDYGIPFVQDWYYAKDVCQHPEFEHMHGFFSSPATCLLTDAPIPVLSQAAPTSFGDIMYPSPWYMEKVDQGDYKEEEDPPWEEKVDTLYWAGSTTGSHSTNGSWKHSHRQRFVELVQTLNETSHKYLKQVKPGVWDSYDAIEDHHDLFDVKLTAVIQCDETDCDEQKEFFDLTEKEERSQQFHSRFVFDADGNSFSGRYYTLLQSRSIVVKQTVLKEWHDERIIPWVHFTPVSLSMDELPEIMKYMTGNEQGRQRAKEIADASREWHKVALRREDATVYLYRLMLELARIMDQDRDIERNQST